MYYIYLQDGNLNGAGQGRQLTEGVENIVVTEEQYNNYVENPNMYIYQDGAIVVNPNYEQEQLQKLLDQFNTEFFNTSLGYVKRKVTMKDGSIKDFLSDILPLLTVNVPIITYNYPDVETGSMPTQNVGVLTTEQFISECKQQVLVDFYGAVQEEVTEPTKPVEEPTTDSTEENSGGEAS